MKLRFVTSVADAKRGSFVEGRVIEIDPASKDFADFQKWIDAGICVPVRATDDPTKAPERAVAPAQSSRATGQAKRPSASRPDQA